MLKAFDPFRFVFGSAVGGSAVGWMNQRHLQMMEYLRAGNSVFREQMDGRRLRLKDGQRRRLAAKAKGLGRKLIAQKYDRPGKRRPGRPTLAREIETLVVRMAEQNRDWGYSRIQGALSNLCHEIARTSEFPWDGIAENQNVTS
jgi:putative transposase